MTIAIAAGRKTGSRARGALRIAVILLGVAAVGACAPVPKDPEALRAYQEANDPLEPTNRKVFKFNMALDRNVMKPVAKAYRKTFPAFVRNSLRNFLDNIAFPQTFINDVLQGKPGRAAETAMRFFVNTVAGVFGFFDVAAQYGLPAHKEDFGQTLAVWGVTEGPYLMIPFLGPHSARHAAGRVGDELLDPLTYVAPGGWQYRVASITSTVIDIVDTRARNIEALEDLERNSLDLYATIRSLYRQNRASKIRDGKPAKITVPEIVE
jgi:phospholipid-binding lipoprotein MlaA